MAKWLAHWMVDSSRGNRKYKVSYGDDGSWGCSCPAWKYNRQECRHIMEIINEIGRHPALSEAPYQKPMYVLTENTSIPYYDEVTNELRIPKGYPNSRVDQEWLEVHICHIMIENGYSIREIRSIRGLDEDKWKVKYIERKFKEKGAFRPGTWVPGSNIGIKKKSKNKGKIRELMVLGE